MDKAVRAVAQFIAKMGFSISSAYRCPDHNREIGGASNSQHMKGRALDVLLGSYQEQQMFLARFYELLRPDIIIVYSWGLHLDWRKGCSFLSRFEEINQGK